MEFLFKQGQQKLNGQIEVNHAQNGKGMDEREDFLQQIRKKVSRLFSVVICLILFYVNF